MSLNKFIEIYRERLFYNIWNHAEEFMDGSITDGNKLCDRMETAINKGSFNKDSRSIKETCKILGIKHTYKSIGEFIRSNEL